jgi:Zn-dependent protease
MFTLIRMATLNAFLGVFNLIPLPPLDGGKVALRLLPPDWAAKLVGFHPYSFLIGILPGLAAAVLMLLPFHGLLMVVISFL